MDEVERAKHEAAVKLQKFVNGKVANGAPIKINDPEAAAVIDAISIYVIKSIEAMLTDERKVAHGE